MSDFSVSVDDFGWKFDGLTVVPEAFCWLSEFGIVPISEVRMGEQYELPGFLNLSKLQTVRHKVFNTFGRSHWFTHCAIGAVAAG